MKTIISSLAVLFLVTGAIPVNAQTEDLYKRKIDNFKPMKTIGIVLIVAAVPVGALGAYWIADSENTSDDLEGLIDWTGEIIFGYVFVLAAGTSLIAGTVMTIISTKMIKKYQSKLDGLKVGTYYTPNHAGFTLTYRF